MDNNNNNNNILTKEDAIEVIRKIEDPELMIDIWTLGLIYDVEVKEDNNIYVKMTFTSMMCPYGPILLENVKSGLKIAGFKEPKVDVVFNPPWEPSEEVRMLLGLA